MARHLYLVDYDNVRDGRFRHGPPAGRGVNARDHNDFIEKLLLRLSENAKAIDGALGEIDVRLYSGWRNLEGDPTDLMQMITSVLSTLGTKVRRGSHRFYISVADTLLIEPGLELVGTWRLHPYRGLSGLTAPMDVLCPQSQQRCVSLTTFEDHWARGRCAQNQCRLKTEDHYFLPHQKMVDTLMTADALTASTTEHPYVSLVSHDDDVVPAILALALKGRATQWLRFGRRTEGVLDRLVARGGVSINDHESIQ
jgi:hypothetical protein